MGLKTLYEEELLQVLSSQKLKQFDVDEFYSFLDDAKLKEVFVRTKFYKDKILEKYPFCWEMNDLEKRKHYVWVRREARKKALEDLAAQMVN